MKYHQQSGYVLHKRPYSESSLLVDIFCREHGRFMVISKGARRQKSGVSGVLMPFTPLLFSWTGKGQLPILISAESRSYRTLPRGRALQSAYYINELILKLLHRFDAHAALYDYYNDAMLALSSTQSAAEILRVFEKHLLQEIGFGLVLDHDVETGEVITKETNYHYYPERGPIATAVNQLSDDHPNVISGKSLLALEAEKLDSREVKLQVKNLVRNLISHQLNGKQLRSRRVMMQILRYQNPH